MYGRRPYEDTIGQSYAINTTKGISEQISGGFYDELCVECDENA